MGVPKTLTSLRTRLPGRRRDEAKFAELVNTVLDLGYTETEIAELVAAPVPTVKRWRAGEVAPQPGMRELLAAKLERARFDALSHSRG